MSLRGRHVIDNIKTRVGTWLKLPCPPYGNPRYWYGVYKSLGPYDVYEWGSTTLTDSLLEYEYQLLDSSAAPTSNIAPTTKVTSTFAEAIGVNPEDSTDKPIILLGCGNSRLGEEMAEHGWRGPLIQVDVVSRCIATLAERCAPLVEDGTMDFVEDDATHLSAFDDNQVNAVIDKGLVDALFCADEHDQVKDVVSSVHRVLKPGGMFVFFSLSQPKFLMPQMLPKIESQKEWKDIQVRQLESILMYRLEKDDGSMQPTKGLTRQAMQRNKKKSKRQ